MKIIPNAVDQQVANTNFATDSVSKLVEPAVMGSAHSPMLASKDYSTLTLDQLLCSPVSIRDGVITTALPIKIALQSHSAILQKSPFMLSKLRGFMGIRATIVLRLVVNADKYTQGRLCVSYKPQQTQNSVDREDHRHATQLTHVTLDLNTETEVTLKIPHRGPFTHYDITEGRYNTGVFQITELLKHRGNPYTFNIYMNYEDIDLIGPTTSNTIEYQSGLDVEQTHKPLSEKVSMMSSALTVVGDVPLLSSYVMPLAWASGVASRVLSALGWSKPVGTSSEVVIYRRDRPNYNNTDGTDVAETLAMTGSSSVAVDPHLGLTGLDEMSFKFLMGINSVLYRSSWSTTAASGTNLFSWGTAPYGLKSNYSLAQSELNDSQIAHPIAFLADHFEKYRGSLTFTVDFSKTIFHSGRVLIVFVPETQNLQRFNQIISNRTSTDTFADFLESTRNCHKDIIDLRKGNKFVLNFPYVALTPYTNVEHSYGRIYMYVLNQLVASDSSVPTTIDYSISVKAGPDFELAVPGIPRYYPFEQLGQSEGTNIYDLETLPPATYESGLETSNNLIIDKCVGGSVPSRESDSFCGLCIGEKILSVKQLAMRSKLNTVLLSTNTTLPQSPFYIDTLCDSSMRIPQAWSNTETTRYIGPVRAGSLWLDYYSIVGSMYAYVRGGVVMTVENSTASPIYVSLINDHSINRLKSYGEWGLTARIGDHACARVYVPPNSNSTSRYTVRTPIVPRQLLNSPGDYTNTYGYSCPSFQITNVNGDLSTATVSRCAADDTQFGGFRGTPFMILRKPYIDVALDPVVFTLDRKLNATSGFFPAS